MGSGGWSEGDVLASRYRLERILGAGGMGCVWEAEHVQLKSPVAVKVLLPEIAEDEEATARFLREAQAAATLRSSNVVQVLDFGVERDTPYMAMEFLEGESLRMRLKRVGKLSPEETAHVLTHVGRAVNRAHNHGIVHRDLKPGNIHISPPEEDGDAERIKVLDFGIAKVMGASLRAEETETGAMLGTPFYMSPEQARGRREVDHRADLWSLGVVAFQCLTGKRPFGGKTIGDLVLHICSEPIPAPSSMGEVPAGFDAWFARAVERDLDARFQSARTMVASLREVLLGESGPSSLAAMQTFDDSASLSEDAPPESLQHGPAETEPDEGATAAAASGELGGTLESPVDVPAGLAEAVAEREAAESVRTKATEDAADEATEERLETTDLVQSRSLRNSESAPPPSVAAAVGNGLLGVGVLAAAAVALFIALQVRGGDAKPSPGAPAASAAAAGSIPTSAPAGASPSPSATASAQAAPTATVTAATASASAATAAPSASAARAPQHAPATPPKPRARPALPAPGGGIEFGF